jgi:hypothetical protein
MIKSESMKLKNIFLGLACVGVLSACSDNMDYHEYTVYGKDYVFTDFTRTGAFVTNIYSYLDYDIPGLNSLCSACDESEMAITYSSVLDYTNGAWSALNPKSQWGYYSAIRAANYYLAECPDLDFYDQRYDKDYKEQMARFNRYQYEVRLLRAYYYFLLVRAYGDVPFTTKVLTDKEANSLSRTSASEIFKFIVDECDAVASELPITYYGLDGDAAGGTDNPETGRVNRGTALALKARALLYQASPLFNKDNSSELWKEAAEASKEVLDYCAQNNIKLGKYSDLWGADNYKASEMIFVRRVGDMNSPEYYNFPISMENAQAGNCPTQTLVDAYEMKTTGKAWNESESGYDANKPYTNRDPRLGMTVAVNGEKWPSTNPNTLETYVGGRDGLPVPYATPTGYYLKKYLDTTIDISASNSSGGKRHSWITFRLGEFYLNYAEAVFRYFGSADATNNEFTLSARGAVNTIRSRSDVKMPGFSEGMSTADFWAKYKRERMVELAFEGHRFWDVRRWKEGDVFKSITQMRITKNEDATLTYSRVVKSLTWDDKMYFYPIPDSEIRKNSNLMQNEGWSINK